MSELIQLRKVGEILSKVGNELLTNSNLLKLINYNSSDALSLPDITIQELKNIVGKGSDPINQQKIYKYPFINKTTEDIRTELRFFVPSATPNKLYISELYINFQVIIHNSIVELDDNKLRYWEVIYEILNTLNGFNCGSIGELYLKSPVSIVSWSDNYSGYSFNFQTKVF